MHCGTRKCCLLFLGYFLSKSHRKLERQVEWEFDHSPELFSCTEGLFRYIWYMRQASEVLVSVSQTGVIESLDLEKRGDRLGDIGQEWQFENTLVLPLASSATVLYHLGILIHLVNERTERHLKLLMSVTHSGRTLGQGY